jgi:hypothetical protein
MGQNIFNEVSQLVHTQLLGDLLSHVNGAQALVQNPKEQQAMSSTPVELKEYSQLIAAPHELV